MRGSKIAAQIEYEQKQKEFWKNKVKRMKDKKKDMESDNERNNSIKQDK